MDDDIDTCCRCGREVNGGTADHMLVHGRTVYHCRECLEALREADDDARCEDRRMEMGK